MLQDLKERPIYWLVITTLFIIAQVVLAQVL